MGRLILYYGMHL